MPTLPGSRLALATLLPLLGLFTAGCPDGTGDFAPGGKAKGMLQPVDRAAAARADSPAAPEPEEDDVPPNLPPGHPKIGGIGADDLLAQVEAMKSQLKNAPKQLEILLALGDLYFDRQRYLDAIDWYRQAVTVSEAGWKELDALPASARAAHVPAPVKTACTRGGQLGYDALSAAARGHAKKGELAPAAYCWRQALDPALLAQARRGYAFLLVGNPDQGIADEEAVLRRDPDFIEALFYQGACLSETAGEDLTKLRRARASWKRLLAIDPDGKNVPLVQQALAKLEERIQSDGKAPPTSVPAPAPAPAPAAVAAPAGGGGPNPGKINPGLTEAFAGVNTADPAFWKAAEARIAEGEAHLARGEYDQAREQMKALMPVFMLKATDSPLLPRALTDMGIAYIQLGNREVGPRMLRMALEKDPKNGQAQAALDAFEKGRPLPKFEPLSRTTSK